VILIETKSPAATIIMKVDIISTIITMDILSLLLKPKAPLPRQILILPSIKRT